MSYETRNKASGKAFREGLSLRGFFKRFPDDKAAEEWFIKQRSPEEVCCVQMRLQQGPDRSQASFQPYRCRDCGKRFSVRVGTVMRILQTRLSDLVACDLPPYYQPQERFLHECIVTWT